MKTIQKFIESEMDGAAVSANKTYYTMYPARNMNSRSFCIHNTFGLDGDSWTKKINALVKKLEKGFDSVTVDYSHYPQSSTIRLKFKVSQLWTDVAQKFFDTCVPDWEEPNDPQVPEEVKKVEEPKVKNDPKGEIKKIIDGLQVGMNVTLLGIGYASDEKDLEEMKSCLRKMFGM